MGILREYAVVVLLAEENFSVGEAVLDGFSCELKDNKVVFPVFFSVVPLVCLCNSSCCWWARVSWECYCGARSSTC